MSRIAALAVVAIGLIGPAALAQTQNETEPAVNTSADEARPQERTSDAPGPAAAPPSQAPPAPTRRSERVMDRLELESTQITGNRELPKVLYIVPWKRSDLGDLVGRPVGSLLDEVLAPVDRDVFRRENRYYRALQPDESAAAGEEAAARPATPRSGDER